MIRQTPSTTNPKNFAVAVVCESGTSVAKCFRGVFLSIEEDKGVTKKLCIVTILFLAAFAVGCSKTETTANENANAATDTAATTRPAPDNSEVSTSVDANGVKTETRTFRNNPRVSKVVVTTRNGVKTGKVISPSGEERELKPNEVERALDATGEKVADAAGFVVEGAKPAVTEVGDKAEDVKDKTVSGAKKVGSEVGDKAEDVKDQTVSGAKTVGSKTVQGTKKAASETKKAVKKVIP